MAAGLIGGRRENKEDGGVRLHLGDPECVSATRCL